MEVAGLLKEEYPNLPIILLTANQSKSLTSQAEALNISVFHKPVDPNLLSSTLAKISSNRQIKLV
jgi:CheY-like chemotaxis protein